MDEAEKRGRHLQVMVMIKDGVSRRGFKREEGSLHCGFTVKIRASPPQHRIAPELAGQAASEKRPLSLLTSSLQKPPSKDKKKLPSKDMSTMAGRIKRKESSIV